MLLLCICCMSNAQQIQNHISITKIEVEEPSCEDALVGKIVVMVETNYEGKLVFIAERTSHIGQKELEEADQYTSEDGVFSDCLPGCYTITVSLADSPDLFVSRSVVLSQLTSTGSLTTAKTDIVDNYCKKTTGSIIIRVTETAEQPEWFAMFDAETGVLVKLVTAADQEIEEGLSCSFTGIAPGKYFFKAGNNTNSCVIQSDRNNPVMFVHPISGSATVLDVTCKGDRTGGITVWATGGVPELRYILLNEDKTVNANITGAVSGVFTSLPANTYHVVVKDAASCADTLFDIKVREPEKILAFSANQTRPVGCDLIGGTFVVTASGGWSGYMYKIDSGNYSANPVFENLKEGNHTIVVRDAHNCEHSENVTAKTIKAPDLSTSEIGQIICFNDKGKITIHAFPDNLEGSNVNKITLYWIKGDCLEETPHSPKNIFTDLNGCTYTLYAQDSYGCIGETTVVLVEPESQLGLVLKEAIQPVGDKRGSITVTASGGWEEYAITLSKVTGWSQELLVSLTGKPEGDYTFDNLVAGQYQITLKDKMGCTAWPIVWELEAITTGEKDLEAAAMKIFPNPSVDGMFIMEWITTEDRKVTIELYNIHGQLVYKTITQTGTRTTLDISNQNQGMYLLLVPELGVSRKIIIQ